MTISSRTPEGQPTSCPLCLAAVVVEPSILVGDATCPRCGHLLWFLQTSELTHVLDAHIESIANNPTLLHDLDADSLDTVELAMLLEEELAHDP